MGVKIAATLDSEKKPQFTASTVAAASFTCDDTDLCLWVGSSITLGRMEVLNALKNCLQYIRENGNTTPAGANESYAETASTRRNDINGAFNAVAAVPEETKVGFWYGPTYQQTPGASITPGALRLIEKYNENYVK